MKKVLRFALPIIAGAQLFASAALAEKSHYPLTIDSCGHALTFDKAPERVVGIGQGTIEILYSLGLADKVVGTSLWVEPVLAEFKEVNDKIDVLADNDVSFESIIAKKPDLITNQFQWQIGDVGVVATVEQFSELNIPVYTSPADCVGKDNSEGGDGVRKDVFNMELIYKEISDLANIFDVQDRGEKLITDLKNRELAAKKKVQNLPANTSALFWFSSADAESDPYVAGAKGAPGFIMSSLGVKNIVTTEEEWPTVSWENIVRENPTVIVVGDMNRRRFPLDDVNVKLEYLKNDPVLKLMPAVENQRIIVIGAQSMNPTLRTMEGLEKVADALSKMNLQ
ncbi:ABC transporter substrate-binding protein [Providencia stuartii]|nr:ABC transporter substrate-binding protein [Providencia stuartii]